MKHRGHGKLLPGLALLLAATGTTPGAAGDELTALLPAAEAVAADLVVTVSWGLGSEPGGIASLSLADADGEIVSRVDVEAIPGSVQEVLLPDAFANLGQYGLGYRLLLTDAGGEALAAPLAVRVVLDCLSEESCTPVAVVSYEVSGGALISETLAAALAEIEAGGAENVLSELREARPELLGEILTFSYQLSELFAGLAPGGPCVCQWIFAYEEDPATCEISCDLRFRQEAAAIGIVGTGAYHLLGAQSFDGPASMSGRGESRITSDLNCWEPQQLTPVQVTVAGQPLTWSEPVLSPCAPCAGEVEHRVGMEVSLDVEAQGSSGEGSTFADGFEILTAEADGTAFLSETVALAAAAGAGQLDSDFHFSAQDDTIFRPAPSTLTVSSDGEVKVDASGEIAPPDSQRITWSFAFADLTVGFFLESTGRSACARTDGHLRRDRFSPHAPNCWIPECSGGIRIERWLPPAPP